MIQIRLLIKVKTVFNPCRWFTSQFESNLLLVYGGNCCSPKERKTHCTAEICQTAPWYVATRSPLTPLLLSPFFCFCRRRWTPVPWCRLYSAAWPTTPTCPKVARSTRRRRTTRLRHHARNLSRYLPVYIRCIIKTAGC